jgi:hypothetical protein
MAALGAVALGLVAQQRMARTATSLTEMHSAGPLRASIAADGDVQLGGAVQALPRSQALGWLASFCVAPGGTALLQVLLRRADDPRVLFSRARVLGLDASGCASAAWAISLPPDIAPGRYLIERNLLLTPAAGAPAARALPAMFVSVLP